jgi:hypothetical protein
MPPDSAPGHAIREMGKTGEEQQVFEGLDSRLTHNAMQIGIERKVLDDGYVLIEPEPLRHVANGTVDCSRLGLGVKTANREAPLARH